MQKADPGGDDYLTEVQVSKEFIDGQWKVQQVKVKSQNPLTKRRIMQIVDKVIKNELTASKL